MVVVERRNLAILLGRKSGQHGSSRVHDQGIDTRGRHRVDECREKLIVVAIIDADPAFHRDRQVRAIPQTAHAVGHQSGLEHEAGAKRAVLDAVAGAADVEIDLGVTRHGADARRFGKFLRIAAAELQSDRMLGRVMVEQAAHVAAHDGLGDNHFRVQQGMGRIQPVQVTAVAVGPIHHRGHAQFAIQSVSCARDAGFGRVSRHIIHA